jgi:hypothetical protein
MLANTGQYGKLWQLLATVPLPFSCVLQCSGLSWSPRLVSKHTGGLLVKRGKGV